MKALVVGCGAWGTSLAKVLSEKNDKVYIACHSEKIIEDINLNRVNSYYGLIEPKLSSVIEAISFDEISLVIEDVTVIFVVVSSNFYRSVMKILQPMILDQHIIVSATKGMEESGLSMLEIDRQIFSVEQLNEQFCVLSGPNLAKEIYQGLPAATVIASHNINVAKIVQQMISSESFRAYVCDDVIGVMYGGILKNVIALAAGIVDAMNLGTNAKSALMVRGIAEMRRFCLHVGGQEDTVFGLSGFGDLITTCNGPKSRNYSVGLALGKGERIDDILSGMVDVAEGVTSSKVIHQLSIKQKIEMPIITAVYKVIYESASIKETISSLMNRDLKKED
jgi:glycerol-3-phosphate dehydrogenase (NAD(P)+)